MAKALKSSKPPAASRSVPRAAAPGKAKSAAPSSAAMPDPNTETFKLRLYVAGQTTKSVSAFANLKRLCEQHLTGRYTIEVIDLLKNPALAAGDQIIAVPTLVKNLPPPLKRVIGNLADEQKFLVGLDLKATF